MELLEPLRSLLTFVTFLNLKVIGLRCITYRDFPLHRRTRGIQTVHTKSQVSVCVCLCLWEKWAEGDLLGLEGLRRNCFLALLLWRRTHSLDADIARDPKCCCGSTPSKHRRGLESGKVSWRCVSDVSRRQRERPRKEKRFNLIISV